MSQGDPVLNLPDIVPPTPTPSGKAQPTKAGTSTHQGSAPTSRAHVAAVPPTVSQPSGTNTPTQLLTGSPPKPQASVQHPAPVPTKSNQSCSPSPSTVPSQGPPLHSAGSGTVPVPNITVTAKPPPVHTSQPTGANNIVALKNTSPAATQLT